MSKSINVPKPGDWSTLENDTEVKLTELAQKLADQLLSGQNLEENFKSLINFRKEIKLLDIQDTVPRENIYMFAVECGEVIGLRRETISDIWKN